MKVSVLTINLDGLAHLQAFLPSLMAQDRPPDEVIVVDNGSADGSVAWLEACYPRVKVLRNPTNQGFARANNQAAEAATGDLLLLLNNDMHLAPDCLRQLVEARQRLGPGVPCLGARILDWDGQRVDFVAAAMTFEGKGMQLGHGEPADSAVGRGAEHPLLFACGGAMLVDRAVYLEAGGLDEAFFAYYEDVDFGWRLWVLGHEVRLCPQAVAHHRHNGTSSRFAAYRKEVLLERNGLMAMLKNYDDASLARFLPAALLLLVKRLAVRSGLDRAQWDFAPAARPAPPPAAPGREPLPRRLANALRRRGARGLARHALFKVGQKLVGRFGPPPEAGHGDTAPIDRRAYASAVAVEDLLDQLPAVLAKRRRIQAARRRPDAEVFALFGLPFQPVEGQGRYPDVQAQLVAALGLDR